MFLQQRRDGGLRLVTSASDLTAASRCEFAFLRRVDQRLGRDVVVPPDDDPMLARAAELGDAHEARLLRRYRDSLGLGNAGSPGGVVEIARPESMSAESLEAAAAETLAALSGGAELVFQATFFEPGQRTGDADEPGIGFVGFADFLRRMPDGAYEVQDAKLARRAKVGALMQLAAYAEQLDRIGVPVAEEAVLILGDGARSRHRIDEIAPVFRARRARLHRLLLGRASVRGADGRRESAAPLRWGDPDVTACGRCEVCEPEIVRTRDPLLVAGMRAAQRDRLREAGISTVDELAALGGRGTAAPSPDGRARVAGISDAVLDRLIAQAQCQLEARPGSPPPVRVIDASALAAIPDPDPGDLFFDFEGDPLFREPGSDDGARWGIDYLFGMVDAQQRFMPIWAHDLESEREALVSFLDLVARRRRRFPGMHIYHYASYERAHLLSLAARHGVGEDAVDALLRDHVLVDLYPIVRRSMRVGTRSYSIKKLEPLYMGDELRDEHGVTNGAQSVSEYAEASAQLRSSEPLERREGERRLAAIADYNRYDCVSTLRLRDWLREVAVASGGAPARAIESPPAEAMPEDTGSPLASRLAAVETADPRRAAAYALAAAAIDYHRREQKSFWWAHYARLIDPIEDWADTRDVLLVDASASSLDEEWQLPPRARVPRRRVRLGGTLAPGSTMKPGSEAFALYELPAPFPRTGDAPGARAAQRVRIVERRGDGVTIEEPLPNGAGFYEDLPVAIVPGPPPAAGRQKTAIEQWGREILASASAGREPRDPAFDLLLRNAPRLSGGGDLSSVDSGRSLEDRDDAAPDAVERTVATLRRLDDSALAVQGPPGTGKTYLAARVIARLAETFSWRIGVVAQSHRVVEHLLEGVVSAGLEAARVGKVPQGGRLDPDVPAPGFTVLAPNGHARFLREHAESGRGAVIGGTAWDFSNEQRFDRRGLDLLVIDEAGQFSLAPTIAASVAARNLLLLGDPQQLPQVSQGAHPAPVDASALGWLLGPHETMPEPLGFFLSETRRMRPELAEVVSELAYEGRLRAHPSTAELSVESFGPPGLTWHPVEHSGNSTSSPEEAVEVVRIARRALGGASLRGRGSDRPLTPADLIVVAAYNAQVECVASALAEAGLGGIRVGTVDRFQGQEAVIALVTLAASSAEDVPRGLEFLLMRNRLNVAISRAQWSAHLVSSARLGEALPQTAEGLVALSGYLRLLERGAGAGGADLGRGRSRGRDGGEDPASSGPGAAASVDAW